MTQNLFYDLPNDLIDEIQTRAYKMVHEEFVGNLTSNIHDELIEFYKRVAQKYWDKYMYTMECISKKIYDAQGGCNDVFTFLIDNDNEQSSDELIVNKRKYYKKYKEYNNIIEELCDDKLWKNCERFLEDEDEE